MLLMFTRVQSKLAFSLFFFFESLKCNLPGTHFTFGFLCFFVPIRKGSCLYLGQLDGVGYCT